MSYCTTTDVKGLNPKRTYDATTTPTLAQVQEYVDRIAAEIDTILQSRGYSTPVTTPSELVTFLKQLNALGAGSMAERAMFPESQGLMSSTSAAVLWRQYQDGLKFLKEGSLSSTTEALPFSFFERNRGNDTEPTEDHDWQKPKFGKNKEF